jgi:hypothetical protein
MRVVHGTGASRESRPQVPRGCSSVGRALEWHSRGQGFDSPQLHSTALTGGLGRERSDGGIGRRAGFRILWE